MVANLATLLRKISIILIMTSIATSTFFISSMSTAQADFEEKKVIFFHEGKNPFLNSTYMSQAFEILEQNDYRVISSKEPLNSTSLIGIDILMIPNPEDGKSYTTLEKSYIKKFLEIEDHGLFLLSNPYTVNESLESSPDIFNDIISSTGFFPANTFSLGAKVDGVRLEQLTGGTNEFNDTSIHRIDLVNATEQMTFLPNTSVVTQSNNVKVLYQLVELPSSVVGYQSDGLYETYASTAQDKPCILGSTISTTTGSRLMLSGSNIMFSDLLGPDGTNTWINTANNSYLLVKALDWLANREEASKDRTVAPTDLLIFIFVAGVVLMAFGIVLFTKGTDPNKLLEAERAKGDVSKKDKKRKSEQHDTTEEPSELVKEEEKSKPVKKSSKKTK